MTRKLLSAPSAVMAVVALAGLLGLLSTPSAAVAGAAPGRLAPRATQDRPDQTTALQVHVIYAVPADGVDRQLDRNGTLATSVLAWQHWLQQQTGGPTLRVDTYAPQRPDITFVRLGQTDAQIASNGAFVRDALETELAQRGLVCGSPSQPPVKTCRKIYAVYYDGSSTFSCGGGAWPPVLPGRVAALYLQGLAAGPVPCNTNPFTTDTESVGYLELSMLHELIHTLGFVGTCAPHQWRSGHVPEANDLMYAGDAPWDLAHAVLDVGRDDYYTPPQPAPGCTQDLSRSGFMTS